MAPNFGVMLGNVTQKASLTLPESLRRVLPAARWEDISGGFSGASVWTSQRYVVKVQPREVYPVSTLQQEFQRLRWFQGRLPVPQVVGYEATPTHEYLAMTRLSGIPMSDPDALLHPGRVVNLLARALRELHALPLQDCPFNMTLPHMLHLARERVQAGVVDADDFDEERQGQSATGVFNELIRTRPDSEDLVITHGDACLPNFIMQGEHLEGLIDLGRAGIADRHMDLALAWRSTRYNLNADWAERLLDEYGRNLVNEHKIRYYCLLDELY